MDKIAAFAPATIANLSVGFDVLGLALDSVGDKVQVEYNSIGENRITEIVNGPNLPKNVKKNSCSGVIKMMQDQLNDTGTLDIKIYKGFQSGSGMGSSSASSAAAAFAYNTLVGDPFSREELIRFAAEGERIACGSAHVDNVAPALVGGIVLVREHNPVDLVKLPVPKDLFAVILFPKVEINTKDSRGILRDSVPVAKAIKQWANMGAFVSSLYTDDMALLSRSMQDLIAEPTRKVIIPMFEETKAAAIEAGALSFGISGSGPSLYALVRGEDQAKRVQSSVLSIFEGTGIDTFSMVEALNGNIGARVCDNF